MRMFVRWCSARASLASVWGLAGLAAVAACSQNTVVLPARNLDRPTDMTFTCVGTFEEEGKLHLISGQPMDRCHPSGVQERQRLDMVSGAAAPAIQYRTYAFLPNAERGDLSAIDMSYCRPDDGRCFPPGARVVDLDSASVGFGAAPLGVLPEVIAASQDGCRLVTANRGSCDLTLVNPGALLTPHLDTAGELSMPPAPREAVTTIVPRHAGGRLIAAPGEIAFVPQQTAALSNVPDVCGPVQGEGTLAPPAGDPMPGPGQRIPWRAVVTFPSCDLVALLELPSGVILDSYRLVADATDAANVTYQLAHTGNAPVCPRTDCLAGGSLPPAGTGGSGGGGGGGGGGGSGGMTGASGGTAGGGGVGGAGGSPTGEGGAAGASAGAAGAAAALVEAMAPVGSPSSLGLAGLAIHPEGTRVFFGASNVPFVFALDLVGAQLVEPAAGKMTPLHARAGGTVRLRLSVDPYAYSKGHDAAAPGRPDLGRFVAGRHDDQPSDPLEFLYVIAKDGSLRILNVASAEPFECDVGIDPSDPEVVRLNSDPDDAFRTSCFPFKETRTATDPRRLLSAGIPGHQFDGPVQDVAFANYRTPFKNDPTNPALSEALLHSDEQMLTGAFAFAMTSAGAVHILNIDPELRRVSQVWRESPTVLHDKNTDSATRVFESPRPLTHSVRDFNVTTYSPGLGAQVGPPRLDAPPTSVIPGPHLKGFEATESRIDARLVPNAGQKPVLSDTFVYFPNRATVRPQTWRLEWEGDLTGVRLSGDIIEQPPSEIATVITDNGAGFCGLGGGDGDLMTLTGCDADSACPVGNVCVHSDRVAPTIDGRAIQGMCVPRSMRDDPVCDRMLRTFRRYEIVNGPSSNATNVTVVPRRSEVPRPAYTNAAGQRVACNPERGIGLGSDCQPGTSPSYEKFECREVTARPDGTPLLENDLHFRCLRPCENDDECRAGRVCLAYPGVKGKVCAEGAPIVSSCGLDQLFAYKLSAGNAFVVNGSVSGRTESLRTAQRGQGPTCERDLTVPNLVARIPMNTPECSAASKPAQTTAANGNPSFVWDDAFLGRVAAVPPFPSPDPCLLFEPGLPQPPAAGGIPPMPTVSALFENTEVRFVLTDLQAPFVQMLQIQFTVNGGVSPQLVMPTSDSTPGLPSRIVVGPIPSVEQTAPTQSVCVAAMGCDAPGRFSDLPYLFVVDQRQFLGGRLLARGQILRITPRLSDPAPYPGFESFAASGKYFPIQ